jgi:hypothetical protein
MDLMALSNWDILAADQAGAPSTGIFNSPQGVTVEIYKNRLHVFVALRIEKPRKQARRPNGSRKPIRKLARVSRDVLLSIQDGRMHFRDVSITAKRGPQGGVYCVVESTIYPPSLTQACPKCGRNKPYAWHARECPDFVDTKHVVMVGCGVYGYTDDGSWVGVTHASRTFLADWLSSFEYDYESPDWLAPERVESYCAATGSELIEVDGKPMLRRRDYAFDEHVRAISLDNALRFNQGDAFFDKYLGTGMRASPPGGASEPLMTTMVQGHGSEAAEEGEAE